MNRRLAFGIAVTSALFVAAGAGMALPGRAQETTSPSRAAMLQPAIDLAAAQEIALREFPGAVVSSVELDRESGSLVYEVSLSAGDVDLDAMTGVVLRTELED